MLDANVPAGAETMIKSTMKKYLFMAAALAATGACAAAQGSASAHEAGYASAADISCSIAAHPTRHGYAFVARAHGAEGAGGDYELTLTKSGPSGDSDIVQAGGFALGSGHTNVLGEAEVSVGRGDRVDARLIVHGDNGEVCRATRRI